jgi:hypothetical protein
MEFVCLFNTYSSQDPTLCVLLLASKAVYLRVDGRKEVEGLGFRV